MLEREKSESFGISNQDANDDSVIFLSSNVVLLSLSLSHSQVSLSVNFTCWNVSKSEPRKFQIDDMLIVFFRNDLSNMMYGYPILSNPQSQQQER